MSKKVSIIVSVVLFIILMILFACEINNPEAGSALIYGILK